MRTQVLECCSQFELKKMRSNHSWKSRPEDIWKLLKVALLFFSSAINKKKKNNEGTEKENAIHFRNLDFNE